MVSVPKYGSRDIEPVTDAHRLAIRRAAAVKRINAIPGNEWALLPVERLESVVAEVAAAKAGAP